MYAADVYSGTAGLTAALRRVGLTNSLGVDAHVTKQVRAPVVRLDLTTPTGVELLWKILQSYSTNMLQLFTLVLHAGRAPEPGTYAGHMGQTPNHCDLLRSSTLPTLQGSMPSEWPLQRSCTPSQVKFLPGVQQMAFCAPLRTQQGPICGPLLLTQHLQPLVNSHEGLWSPNDLSSVIAQVCHRLLLSVDVIDIPVIPVQMQQDDMCTTLC